MIRSFRGNETERIFRGIVSRRFPRDIQPRTLRKLEQINQARSLDELRTPPGNRLERLERDRLGQWSIRVNDQFRICFRWEEPDAFDVELTDYHQEPP